MTDYVTLRAAVSHVRLRHGHKLQYHDVLEAIKTGKLRANRTSRSWEISLDELLRWAKEATETPREKRARQKEEARRKEQAQHDRPPTQSSSLNTEPRQAAKLTERAGQVLRSAKDFAAETDRALAANALSPEHKAFLVRNYIEPSHQILAAIQQHLTK